MPLPSVVTRSRRGLREVALLGGLFVGYELLRAFGRADVSAAVDRGWWLVRWQTALGLPPEADVQGLALPHEDLVAVLNHYYVWVHFPGTALFLVWLWRRHHRRYARFRTVLVTPAASRWALADRPAPAPRPAPQRGPRVTGGAAHP